MTRVNLVEPQELSDQHLIAEYRELPRCIKQCIDTTDAPLNYCLGKGHMKWAKKHSKFLIERYKKLCAEMRYREFAVNYPAEDLIAYYKKNCKQSDDFDYVVGFGDFLKSRARLLQKITQKPNWYKWTKRVCPYKSKRC